MSTDSLRPVREAAATHLAEELGDSALAKELAEIIGADALQWRPAVVDKRAVKTIVAYSFGNRIDVNGNRSPGPVNAALADIAVRMHAETSAPVYAQWEIADAIGSRIPASRLISIAPLRNKFAETVYLSTGGVAAAVAERAGGADRLGKVGVVAFSDHIKRCVDVSRAVEMDASAVEGYVMPTLYDGLSGQPWTRSRLTYLMHDIMCRAEDRRNALITGT